MHKQPTKTEQARRVVFQEQIPFGQQNAPTVQQKIHMQIKKMMPEVISQPLPI